MPTERALKIVDAILTFFDDHDGTVREAVAAVVDSVADLPAFEVELEKLRADREILDYIENHWRDVLFSFEARVAPEFQTKSIREIVRGFLARAQVERARKLHGA